MAAVEYDTWQQVEAELACAGAGGAGAWGGGGSVSEQKSGGGSGGGAGAGLVVACFAHAWNPGAVFTALAMEQLRSGMRKLDAMDSIDETRPSKHKSKGRTFAALQAKRAARGQATAGVRGRGPSLEK